MIPFYAIGEMTKKGRRRRNESEFDAQKAIIQFNYKDKQSKPQLVREVLSNHSNIKKSIINGHSLDSSLELLLSSSLDKRKNTSAIENRLLNKPIYDVGIIDNLQDKYKLRNNTDNRYSGNNFIQEEAIKNINSLNDDISIKKQNDSYEKTLGLVYNNKNTYFPNFKEFCGDLEEAQKDMAKYFSEIPRYCYFIESEYKNYKEKYEKIKNDFTEQSKLLEDLTKRTEELTVETTELKGSIKCTITENTQLKNNQILLNTFKNETDRFIGVLKDDLEKKNEEVKNLIQENKEFKIQNSRKEYDVEILEMELRNKGITIEKMSSEINLIKNEVENQISACTSILDCFKASQIHLEISELGKENYNLLKYKRMLEETKLVFYILKENFKVIFYQNECLKSSMFDLIVLHDKQIKHYTSRSLIFEEKARKYEVLLTDSIKPTISLIAKQMEEIRLELKNYHSINYLESLKSSFVRQQKQQKQEFDLARTKYEKQIASKNKKIEEMEQRIKELTGKIEEQEDVWEVFK